VLNVSPKIAQHSPRTSFGSPFATLTSRQIGSTSDITVSSSAIERRVGRREAVRRDEVVLHHPERLVAARRVAVDERMHLHPEHPQQERARLRDQLVPAGRVVEDGRRLERLVDDGGGPRLVRQLLEREAGEHRLLAHPIEAEQVGLRLERKLGPGPQANDESSVAGDAVTHDRYDRVGVRGQRLGDRAQPRLDLRRAPVLAGLLIRLLGLVIAGRPARLRVLGGNRELRRVARCPAVEQRHLPRQVVESGSEVLHAIAEHHAQAKRRLPHDLEPLDPLPGVAVEATD
jgi:hypothetical protein